MSILAMHEVLYPAAIQLHPGCTRKSFTKRFEIHKARRDAQHPLFSKARTAEVVSQNSPEEGREAGREAGGGPTRRRGDARRPARPARCRGRYLRSRRGF